MPQRARGSRERFFVFTVSSTSTLRLRLRYVTVGDSAQRFSFTLRYRSELEFNAFKRNKFSHFYYELKSAGRAADNFCEQAQPE